MAVVIAALALGQHLPAQGHDCAALAKLSLPATKNLKAEIVEAGKYPAPQSWRMSAEDAQVYKLLPAFCRVTAELTPSADSDVKIEVWMPVTGWNGKFRGQGNGGFAGEIDYDDLANAVRLGYASGGTDTGHSGVSIDGSWALGHPEKAIDFGNRAIHEMTVKSKSIVEAFYGSSAKHSYFAACSDGGREALMEAQRFPDDYDGILAGAPANNWAHMLTNAVHNAQALTVPETSYIPPAKLQTIASAVLATCDKADGVADGILSDPQSCRFDPGTLLCKGEDSDKCLTTPQVAALRQLYAGAHGSAGKLVFPGYVPGAELDQGGWQVWITGPSSNKSLMFAFGNGFFSNFVYADPKWDYKTFNVDTGLKAAMEKTASALDATNPDLRAFAKRGGKLIVYHGWNDPAISALNTIDYYRNVQARTGERNTQSFVRLYLAPGVQHCAGGPGPSSFGQLGETLSSKANDPGHNLYSALEQWVEKGEAPGTVVASKFEGEGAARRATMTRPLCPYPQIAKYKGSGDTNDAANFSCSSSSR
jgi:hypothetical protein